MRSLLVATQERAETIAAILRSEGFDLDVRIGSVGPAFAPPADYMLVFVERAIGVDAIRDVCRPLAPTATALPLIAVLSAGAMTSAEADELIAAGVNVQLGGDLSSLGSRVRFIKQALRKRAVTLAEARDREEHYRTVIAALDEGLVVQDGDGKVTGMNPRAGQILGITDDGVRDRAWRGADWNLMRADGSPGGLADLPGIKALALGLPVRGHVLGARKPDGSIVWISANAHLARDASGEKVVGVVTTFSDITARRRAEDEFREILEKSPDGVFIHRNGHCVWVSKTFAELLGYDDPRQLVGVDVHSFVHPAHRHLVTERLRIRQETGGAELPALDIPMMRRDGTSVDVSIIGGLTMYEGEPAIIGFTRDRTAQRLLEMKLMATERLAALGRLAAGVGHEINNPLAYVMGNLTIAADRLRKGEDGPAIAQLLDEALEGANRVRGIVRDLKVFATRKPDELGPVDIHRVIDSCARMTDTEVRHRARLVRAFGEVRWVKANEARLAQVLLNVILNAAHAIPEGNAHEATITVTTRLEGDGRVAIEVKDTGTGITPADLPHVFEPFFTTKGERGTGLGLSICHMLVAAQDGEMTIESEVGRGTCLTIRLLAENAPEPVVAPRESPPAIKRRRVLVVDDEVRIARWLYDALTEQEHEVFFATSGLEALARIEGSAPFDAIVCDLMMPDLSGMDMHARVKGVSPGLERRMVFMTGGAFTPRAIKFLAENANPCVEKPFEVSELTRAINGLIRE